MELSYVLNAVRRYWWVVVVCVGLGLVPLLSRESEEDTFVSEAVVLVSPPSESRTQVSYVNDPDRYVLGQLEALRSRTLAERVAARLGQGATAADVAAAVEIEHQPGTDVVQVRGTAVDALGAQQLVDAYVDTYFDDLAEQVEAAQGPDVQQLDQRLADISAQLALVDAAIAEAMEPYIEAASAPDAGPIPSVEQVVPNLVSQKTTLLNQYQENLSLKTQLEVSSKLRVTSQIVQRGSLPTEPESSASRIALLAPVAGLVLGLALAVLLARLSPKVLDRRHAAQILRRPIVGTCPRSGAVRRHRGQLLASLPQPLVPFADGMCVRAEAAGRLGEPLRVLVTGTQRGAGATTVAAAMANRFAVGGAEVLLLDANARHPELSRLFARGGAGLADLRDADADAPPRRGAAAVTAAVGVRIMQGLTLAGLVRADDVRALRRQHLQQLLVAAARRADVVVIDGGSIQHSASTSQLMRLVDVVVVTVPVARQRADELAGLARQLSGIDAEVLPVEVPVRTSPLGVGAGRSPSRVAGPDDTDATDVDQPLDAVPAAPAPAPPGPVAAAPTLPAPSGASSAATPREPARPASASRPRSSAGGRRSSPTR